MAEQAVKTAPGIPTETAADLRDRAQAYLQRLDLPAGEIERLLDELDAAMAQGGVTQDDCFAQAYRLIHSRLAGEYVGALGKAAPPDVASIPARLATRFGRLGWRAHRGWPRVASMPPIRRGYMRPPPLDRNPLHWVTSLASRWRRALGGWLRDPPPSAAARLRQLLLLLLVGGPAFIATAYLATVLPHKGSTVLELAILAAGFSLFGWILVGFWGAVAGFWVLFFGDRHGLTAASMAGRPAPEARVAVVMPICDEDVPRVFAGLRAVYESLQATGAGAGFDFFVLSDSRDPDLWVDEEAAWAGLCRDLDAGDRFYYRRRRTHAKRKSGNIADFCKRWGGEYDYMVVLDADSIITGDCLVKLTQMMECHPDAGLIQTQPLAVNRLTPIARIQQFALRVYGPLFAAGLHFFYVNNAHYWGHNAIIRLAPFMAHCALPRLPAGKSDGVDILSHDFVEAAFMRRAGWGVYLAYDLGGSYEEMPPSLLDELKRDRRWCQGNFQHLRLLFSDRLNPAHRALFANGVMAYASALLWMMFLVLSSVEAVHEALRTPNYFPKAGSLFPQWPVWRPDWALSLFACTLVVLFLPKLLGLLRLLVLGEGRSYGGWPALAASAVCEILFTSLIAPVRMLTHARYVVTTMLGSEVRWRAQTRDDRGVPWDVALRFHLPGMLLAAAWGGVLWWITPGFVGWLAPVLLPLLVAPLLTVWSSRPDLGRRLQAWRLFLIPEEARPPRVLRRLRRWHEENAPPAEPGFWRAAVDPAVNALHCALMRHPPALAPALRERREALHAQALLQGPSGLSAHEKAELLADGNAMYALHAAVWTSSRWPRAATPSGDDTPAAKRRRFPDAARKRG